MKDALVVDPDQIPCHLTPTGAKMPAIGFGTFGSDHYTPQIIAEAVEGAITAGYRHIDCASIYGNEPEIGLALQRAMKRGVLREQLWITSKLWNDCHDEEKVIPTFKKSLSDLKLDYLDLYLIHWPFPNHHATGCDVAYRSKQAQAYHHEHYMKTWRQLEQLVEQGLVKHIGTSNMTVAKLKRLCADAKIQPVCNQMELHPHFQQPQLFDFVRNHHIIPVGFCPLGSPNRPERDRSTGDSIDLEDPVILAIAKQQNISPAAVCLKWAIQRGQVPIPFSATPQRYIGNLQCVATAPLSSQQMADIATIDRNCRLIKGQVFLWRKNQDWQDLWDNNGLITPQ